MVCWGGVVRFIVPEWTQYHAQATQPALTELSMRNNHTWGDDAMEAVAHAVSALPNLQRLWMDCGQQRDAGLPPAAQGDSAAATVGQLASALRGTTSLTALSLEGRDLGEVGEAALASALESNCSLTEVFLGEVSGVSGGALRRRQRHRAAIRRCESTHQRLLPHRSRVPSVQNVTALWHPPWKCAMAGVH